MIVNEEVYEKYRGYYTVKFRCESDKFHVLDGDDLYFALHDSLNRVSQVVSRLESYLKRPYRGALIPKITIHVDGKELGPKSTIPLDAVQMVCSTSD